MSTLKGNPLYNKNSILALRQASTQIDFTKAMNSIDLEECNFIIFLSSKQCKEYLKVSNYYQESLNSNCEFLDKEFEFDSYTNKNTFKNENIKKMIYETSKTKFNDSELVDLIKYKNKKDTGVQFYIKYDNKCGKGEVYLIDLYHMAIPTDMVKPKSKFKNDPKKHYSRIKNKVKNNVNLSEIM